MQSNNSHLSQVRKDYKAMFGSLGVALLIMSQNLMQLSSYFFGTTSIFFGILICFAAVLISFEHYIVLKDMVVLLCLACFFVATRMMANNDALSLYMRSFATYGLAGFAFSYAHINKKWLLRCIVTIGAIWFLWFFRQYGLYPLNGFTFGYLVFPVVMASFICAREGKALSRILFSIICCIFTALLIINASRGTIICLLLFFVIQYYQKIQTVQEKIVLLLILMLIAFVSLNYKTVLLYLNRRFPGELHFVEKSLYLIDTQEDITNGRFSILTNIINDYAISDFVFGAGIGIFASTHIELEYTHNLFLSVMLEFGFIGLGYLVYLIIVFFQTIREKDDYGVFLGCAALLPLQFSGVFWHGFVFWLFLFSMNKRSIVSGSSDPVPNSRYLRDNAY